MIGTWNGVHPLGWTGEGLRIGLSRPGFQEKAHGPTPQPLVEFKRQIVQEYLEGETFHGLARRHDIARNLIRIRVAKYETGLRQRDGGR